jgi:hypothetical protein
LKEEADVAEFDPMFRAVEMTLVPQVPKDVRMRIQTARNLGVYAGFSYDLSAVSAYWSISCIEMALWNRSQEIDPSVHNTIVITKFHLEVINPGVGAVIGRPFVPACLEIVGELVEKQPAQRFPIRAGGSHGCHYFGVARSA